MGCSMEILSYQPSQSRVDIPRPNCYFAKMNAGISWQDTIAGPVKTFRFGKVFWVVKKNRGVEEYSKVQFLPIFFLGGVVELQGLWKSPCFCNYCSC